MNGIGLEVGLSQNVAHGIGHQPGMALVGQFLIFVGGLVSEQAALNPHQQYRCLLSLHPADNLIQIGKGLLQGDLLHKVVAAQFHNHQGRLEIEHVPLQAVQALFGGVAADPLVDDFQIQSFLQDSDVAVVALGSKSEGKAVAQHHDGSGFGRQKIDAAGPEHPDQQQQAGCARHKFAIHEIRVRGGSVNSLAEGAAMQELLEELHQRYRSLDEGKLADYIPELAKANPHSFGISLVTADGKHYEVGDCSTRFTIQSISKPFVYGIALEDFGREEVLRRVGVEPTGDAFNSIIRLDEKSKRPYNPMVNAGAIATSNLIAGQGPADRLNRLMEVFATYVGHELSADMSVFLSERSTGHRNRAMAHLMLNFKMIGSNVEEILDLYFQQCSLLVTSTDLAWMAATLANGGVNPGTGRRALSHLYVRDLLSVMFSCGLYDFSGEWAYRVGLPAKSGVGGGMLVVAPGRLGIGVYSPLLDEHGTSVRALHVCQDLSSRLGLHVFG